MSACTRSSRLRGSRGNRGRRAFTLVEAIVVVVVVALLVTLASWGYSTVVDRNHDRTTELRLTQIARAAVAVAADGGAQVAYTEQMISDAVADAVVTAHPPLEPAAGGPLVAAPGQVGLQSPLTDPATVDLMSVDLADGGTNVGLALLSPSGACAAAVIVDTSVHSYVWGAGTAPCSGPEALDRVPTPTGPVGGGGGGGAPPPPPPAAVTGLTAWAEPNAGTVELSWDATPSATGYEVYQGSTVAGAAAWTGAATSTTLPGQAAGEQSVTVVAVVGGSLSDPATVTYTVYSGSNNQWVNAWPIRQPAAVSSYTSPDATNVGATEEAGESTASGQVLRGVWFKFTPTASAQYTLAVTDPTTGTTGMIGTNTIWTFTNLTSAVGGALGTSNWGARSSILLNATAGQTYWIRVSNGGTATAGKFRLRVTRPEVHDRFADAQVVTPMAAGQWWTSADATNVNATEEPGEGTSSGQVHHGLWWKLTVPADGLYTARVIDPTTGATGAIGTNTIWVYADPASVSASPIGTSLWGTRDDISWVGTAGVTYWMKVANGGTNPQGKFRLRVSRAPLNDNFVAAAELDVSTPGATWLAPYDATNVAATDEAGEDTAGGTVVRGVWFKFTAPVNGQYTFAVVDPSNNASPIGTNTVWVYADPASVSASPIGTSGWASRSSYAWTGTAGVTYWVKVANGGAGQAAGRFGVTLKRP